MVGELMVDGGEALGESAGVFIQEVRRSEIALRI